MTFEKYLELSIARKLNIVAVYCKQKDDDEFVQSYIIAFVFNGKYYLARYTECRYSAWSNAPKWAKSIKEFSSKESANAYFKKCSAGYKRI
jgi:hypothetical protein